MINKLAMFNLKKNFLKFHILKFGKGKFQVSREYCRNFIKDVNYKKVKSKGQNTFIYFKLTN